MHAFGSGFARASSIGYIARLEELVDMDMLAGLHVHVCYFSKGVVVGP
jgi:hypothetical protein